MWDDFDDEYESEFYDGDEIETQHCSQCGQEFYEDAVCCPNCGEFVDNRSSNWAKQPLWLRVLILVVILYLIFVMAF